MLFNEQGKRYRGVVEASTFRMTSVGMPDGILRPRRHRCGSTILVMDVGMTEPKIPLLDRPASSSSLQTCTVPCELVHARMVRKESA